MFIALFLTWLIGYFVVFLSMITILSNINQLTKQNVIISLKVSCCSIFAIIAYFVIYIYVKYHESDK